MIDCHGDEVPKEMFGEGCDRCRNIDEDNETLRNLNSRIKIIPGLGEVVDKFRNGHEEYDDRCVILKALDNYLNFWKE